MRLTGKFALVATVIATLSGSILAAPKSFTHVTKGSSNTEVKFDKYAVTVDNADDFLDAVLAGTPGPHTITNTPADHLDTDPKTITLSDGGKLTIIPSPKLATDNTQKLTFAKVGAANLPTDSPILIKDVDFTTPATDVTIKAPVLHSFSKVTLNAPDVTVIQEIINNGGYGSFQTGFANVSKVTAVTPAVTSAPLDNSDALNVCYTLDKNSAKICVIRPAAGADAIVSVSAKVTTNPPSKWGKGADLAPYFVVFIIFLVAPIGVSQIHAAIDAQGYQAGKDASFLPSFYKNLMADTEFAQEDPYSLTGEDDDNTGEIRVDPNTGRPIRTKKAGGANASAADGSDDVTGEETSAYGVSIMAAALMVPFLL